MAFFCHVVCHAFAMSFAMRLLCPLPSGLSAFGSDPRTSVADGDGSLELFPAAMLLPQPVFQAEEVTIVEDNPLGLRPVEAIGDADPTQVIIIVPQPLAARVMPVMPQGAEIAGENGVRVAGDGLKKVISEKREIDRGFSHGCCLCVCHIVCHVLAMAFAIRFLSQCFPSGFGCRPSGQIRGDPSPAAHTRRTVV